MALQMSFNRLFIAKMKEKLGYGQMGSHYTKKHIILTLHHLVKQLQLHKI